MWAHNLPEHVQDSLQEGRTLSDSDNTEDVITQYERSKASEDWIEENKHLWDDEELRLFTGLARGKKWSEENPRTPELQAVSDKRLEELQAEQPLSDNDIMDMLLEEGRTLEEAMSFLADEGMTWEDMTVSMLENFLAEGGP